VPLLHSPPPELDGHPPRKPLVACDVVCDVSGVLATRFQGCSSLLFVAADGLYLFEILILMGKRWVC
jgi:hypothetical protein